VPDLQRRKKNLLTLRKFDEDSYKFSGENSKLKVIRGALVVAKG
jgi:hypothetical protein